MKSEPNMPEEERKKMRTTSEVRDDVAASLENKANAIAMGDYDKDVDFNIRDRVLWAARLYAVADHIRTFVKLSPSEREDLEDAANYLPTDVESVFFIREL